MGEIRYTDKEIRSIVSRGSVRQKARLFLRDRMGYSGRGFILDYATIDRLVLSVEEEDREKWEEFVSFGLRLENGFKDLGGLASRIDIYRTEVQANLLTILDSENYEVLLNSLLVPREYLSEGLLPDEPLREVVLERLRNGIPPLGRFIMTKPRIDEEGCIDLGLKEGATKRAGESYSFLREMLSDFVHYEEAMWRRIRESKLDIPEYEEQMSVNRQRVERPVSYCVRWDGVQDSRLFRCGQPIRKAGDPQEYPFPALREIVEKYSFRLDDIPLEENKVIEFYKQI